MEESWKQLRGIPQAHDDASPDAVAERVREMCASTGAGD